MNMYKIVLITFLIKRSNFYRSKIWMYPIHWKGMYFEKLKFSTSGPCRDAPLLQLNFI